MNTVIAIDGTSASGKSTNARLLAKELGFIHVDTGAMYRTLAWHCLCRKADLTNTKLIARICRTWKARLENTSTGLVLSVKGHIPGDELRSPEVSAAASIVSMVPAVRRWMRKTQRDCLQFGNLVMEGRDIGTNVFPETNFKYYLDANLSARIGRRKLEQDIEARDKRDSQRACAPLMLGLGAKYIDTSNLEVTETLSLLLTDIRAKLNTETKN